MASLSEQARLNAQRELAGISEAAEIIGTPKSGVYKRMDRGRMPPLATVKLLAMGPVWYEDDLERIAEDPALTEADFEFDPLPLAGTAEAAKRFRCDKSQIGRWLRDGRFPDPHRRLRGGPVWLYEQLGTFRPPRKRTRKAPAAA
jgi:hypothetical protein